MRILVTGAAGYIGRFVCRALAQAGFAPIMLDDLSRGRVAPAHYGIVEDRKMTFEAINAALASNRPRSVIHLAGGRGNQQGMRDAVQDDAVQDEDSNIGFTRILLAALARHEIHHLLLASSSAVYGDSGPWPVREEAPLRAASRYGRAKIAAEGLVRDWGEQKPRRWAILRFANAAGADAKDGLGWFPGDKTIVPATIAVAAGERAALQVHGSTFPTPDGTAIRDLMHVQDIAAAIVHALRHGVYGGGNEILNVATGRGVSVASVITKVVEVTSRPIAVEYLEAGGDDIASLILSPARLANLGFVPRRSELTEIVSSAWEWYLNRKPSG